MSEKREKTLASKTIYSGRVLTYYVNDVLCPNGEKSVRECVSHPGGVCILPIVGNKILMEKQYRYPFDCEILELPAGKLEKGEEPLTAALRELEEETGYKTDSLISLGCIYPSVGYTNEVIHLFATDSLVEGQKHLDFDETIDLVEIDEDEVLDLINKNVIKDAKTIAAILKYLNLRK